MMAEHKVSQAAIERCLDYLVQLGLVRRERGRGIFIDGVEPRSNVLGVYADGEQNQLAAGLFLDGVRSAAECEGFRVADFGPLDAADGKEKVFETMVNMGFAGIIIAALSSAGFFDIESNRQFARLFARHRLPIVTCRPFPAVEADSVMPDYFSAFRTLGETIRDRAEGPILFLAHQGMPSLARMYGFRAGLGDRDDLEVVMTPGLTYSRLEELIRQKWRGSLILGVPPPAPGIVSVLQNAPWAAGSGQELAIVLESKQELPASVSAHVVIKPSYELGVAAVKQLIRRIRGYKGEMTHEIVPHKVKLVPGELVEV